MWHAGRAARWRSAFTVVAADLPGYGDSFRPPAGADHAAHSKRALAARPRGRDGRARPRARSPSPATTAAAASPTGWRSTIPEAVTRLAVLDIVPTGEIWRRADATFALGYWHWAFLAQPAPLPERMILGDPDGFWIAVERMGIKAGDERYPDEVVDGLPRAARRPGDRRGDVRGLPRGRDDRPRARRRRPRRAHDRLPGPRAVGRRGRAAALLRRTRSSCGGRSRPASRAGRSRARRTSSSRTRPARSRPTSPASSPRA